MGAVDDTVSMAWQTRGVRSYLAAANLVVMALAWVRIDGGFEGPVLLTVTASHGVTLADLPAVLLVLAAAWLVLVRPLDGRHGRASRRRGR
jgi:UDP-N-acetylmuramyl pentapeptide phosphotransferase/UDP-N-acetylglucosamine-1-phosphate transferase